MKYTKFLFHQMVANNKKRYKKAKKTQFKEETGIKYC